jgi:hypothetical protein
LPHAAGHSFFFEPGEAPLRQQAWQPALRGKSAGRVASDINKVKLDGLDWMGWVDWMAALALLAQLCVALLKQGTKNAF